MALRPYNRTQDLKSVHRIWKEVGWIDHDEDSTALNDFLANGDTLVATINDSAECCVHGAPGTLQYQNETLQMGAVAAVTTSHIARKMGFATQLTAQIVAKQANAGMDVSALGMFDQGFYEKIGFGSGSYENQINFDPAMLLVNQPFRPPSRLAIKDYEAIHAALCARAKGHGNICLNSPLMLKSELSWTEKPFGLGYYDGPNGTLSHFIWGEMKGEHGPYTITVRAYQTKDQLLELLALIKSLGDQVNQISTLEFGEIQLQDLLKQPLRSGRASLKGEFEQTSRTFAYWQLRILNLKSCLAKTHLNSPGFTFNLQLHDPIDDYLQGEKTWRGIGGDYVIHLGENSSATPGHTPGLPTLTASVNAFSRLWLGVRPASSLRITDELEADQSLIESLDHHLRLPRPHFGWDF